jgi:hypothetical protein
MRADTVMEASMAKTNEWDLLKRQFDALVYDEGVDTDSMENIFDDPFRHRFAELITQTAQRNSTSVGYNWPRSWA